MPQKWTEKEKQQLRDIDRRIDEIKLTRPHVSKAFNMTNRELQQAIIETHEMLLKTSKDQPFRDALLEHFVRLLAVLRHRAGVVDDK